MRRLREAGYKLSLEKINVLFHLYEDDGMSQKTLSGVMQRKKTSVVKIINQLESYDLVARVPSPKDQRNNHIYLTPQGRELKEPLYNLVDQHKREIFKGMSGTDIEVYKGYLKQILKNTEV